MDRKEASRKLEKYDLTKFQKKALLATLSIKKGETLTYKQLAARIGHGSAYRAVGTALKKNPLAPEIPCHRVVKSDGTIGSYSAPGGTKRKRSMLIAEGAIKKA